MKFIARYLNVIGLLLLTAFVATAAGMYFNVPARVVSKAASQSAAKYVCPMHPDVVAAKAGKCPECGMALQLATEIKAGGSACAHDVGATDSPSAAPTGCNHAEAGAGGCCSKPASPQTPTAGGCTRLMVQPTAMASE